MKSEQFNFSSKTSSIRVHHDKDLQQGSMNWDRIIYLIILAAIVVGLIYYLIANYYIVSGRGRIITNQLKIRMPIDVTVDNFYAQVGDRIQKGDSLFSYHYVYENKPEASSNSAQKMQFQQANDLIDVRNDIAVQKEERQGIQEQLSYYRKRERMVQKEIKLNVETVKRLNNIQQEIIKLKSDLAVASQKLQMHYAHLYQLRKSGNAPLLSGSSAINSTDSTALFRAPVGGRLSNIYKESAEIAFKSEDILAINTDSSKVMAKVAFDRDVGKNLPIGEKLTIHFDNGESSLGVITDIYSAESDLESIRNLTGTKVSETIITELRPINDQVRKQWRSLSGMGLTASRTLF